jgi:hypothetical protein
MAPLRKLLLLPAIAALASAAPALAQRGWGGPGWGPMMPPPGAYPILDHGHDPREGKVEAVHYLANSPGIAELGHGPVAIASAPGNMSMGAEEATYESALTDQLVKAGYRTDAPKSSAGQLVEFVVSHDEVQPPEPPHSPVSGEVTMVGGNRGSGVGMALAVDLSKPAKALISTRLQARIRNAATHELLWEGHAEIATRDGDKYWTTQAIATKLAAALFRNFPKPG